LSTTFLHVQLSSPCAASGPVACGLWPVACLSFNFITPFRSSHALHSSAKSAHGLLVRHLLSHVAFDEDAWRTSHAFPYIDKPCICCRQLTPCMTLMKSQALSCKPFAMYSDGMCMASVANLTGLSSAVGPHFAATMTIFNEACQAQASKVHIQLFISGKVAWWIIDSGAAGHSG
jgi:hypothetical protein